MLDYFHRNFPDVPTVQASICDCDASDYSVDAVLAWGVMFHLTPEQQHRAIANVATALKPGGLFLFTSGDVDGGKEGEPMNGVPFHYYSFAEDGYRRLLAANGLELESMHKDRGQNCYYLARRL